VAEEDEFMKPNLAACAEAFAREKHAGQFDKVGRPYVEHLARVAAAVETDEAMAIAWLHDVLEDCDVTRLTLIEAGFPRSVVRSVELLTREENDRYDQYIDRICESSDTIAAVIKRADLNDHLDENCPPRLRERYLNARRRINESHGWAMCA
jgi:(p)ppGpp synthase/HD superfamily hydrolase